MNKSIKENIKKIISSKCNHDYMKALSKAVKNCNSVLDVGCGDHSPLQLIKNKPKYIVGVDAFEPSIKKSKEKSIHDKYYLMDVMNLETNFSENSFDCVLANDLIEHLTKEDSKKLIKIMEKIAKKRVIIFTPNGFVEQDKYDNNDLQKHLCGWTYQEMKNMNYEVYGMAGLKYLKGYRAKVKMKPRIFWRLISELSQFFTKKIFPKHSFAIFCVKEIK